MVLEATYGWYWAADVLQAAGAQVHLAHPLGVKGFAHRRVKNDVRDAADLADLLRIRRLPESWIAPAETRELRELVRYRAKLVAFRCAGRRDRRRAPLLLRRPIVFLVRTDPAPLRVRHRRTAQRVASLLKLIDILDAEEDLFNRRT
ncbi:IS110 family transposase [Streptomyces mirabilis]|uniref:IS110 family transposase n=1 Tax=Streptomyces mirabilis TaxID=68239 RepID=UPI0031BB4491